jgi:hypothetical protein
VRVFLIVSVTLNGKNHIASSVLESEALANADVAHLHRRAGWTWRILLSLSIR